jgi:hypothetical protein
MPQVSTGALNGIIHRGLRHDNPRPTACPVSACSDRSSTRCTDSTCLVICTAGRSPDRVGCPGVFGGPRRSVATLVFGVARCGGSVLISDLVSASALDGGHQAPRLAGHGERSEKRARTRDRPRGAPGRARGRKPVGTRPSRAGHPYRHRGLDDRSRQQRMLVSGIDSSRSTAPRPPTREARRFARGRGQGSARVRAGVAVPVSRGPWPVSGSLYRCLLPPPATRMRCCRSDSS